jgi:prolyl 4-hydroxylase
MSLFNNMLGRLFPPTGTPPVEDERSPEAAPAKAEEKRSVSVPPIDLEMANAIARVAAQRIKPPRQFPGLPGSDPELLAEIGRRVREKLEADASAVRQPATNMDMYLVPDFLSAEECSELIALIDADAKPSTRLASDADPTFRTSHTCHLLPSHAVVAETERRMAELLGIELRFSETLQGQRYFTGQQFKTHNDYVAGGQHYSEIVAREGGQRTWTAMVFLNEPEAGGQTNFERAGIRIAPRTGTLLTWNNLDRSGLPNPYTHHEGMKVEGGSKYVLTKWFREREWHKCAESDAVRV